MASVICRSLFGASIAQMRGGPRRNPTTNAMATHGTIATNTLMNYLRPRTWLAAALVALALLGCGRRLEPAAMNQSLISAAEHGDTAAIQRLLAEGADINAQDARGRTPVLAA